MKKNRRLAGLWNRKGGGYALAGICLLLLAGVVLALGTGNRAEAANVTLNGRTLSLGTDDDGAYLIKTADDLKALGMASADETGGTFKLAGDLTVDSITDAATGTFAGTFDGNGYIITIEKLAITTGKDETQASEGVLFGTVTGTVENLAVMIKDEEASYTRESDAGAAEIEGSENTITTGGDAKYTPDQEVTEASSGADLDAYDNIDQYEDVYFDENGNEVESEGSGGTKYKRFASDSVQTTTTSYEAEEAKDNSFGIICGTLGEGGTITQVSVNGEGISVSQSVPENEHTLTEKETVTTPIYYYYKIGDGKKYITTDGNAGSVSFDAPAYYESKTVTDEAFNQAMGKMFTLQVSAPNNLVVKTDGKYEITYEVKVTATEGAAVSGITVTPDKGATTTTGSSNIDIDLSAGESETVTFTRKGTLEDSDFSSEITTTFTATKSDDSGQSVSASSTASTIVTKAENVEKEGKNSTVSANALQIKVESPKAVAPDGGTASWTYTVTVTKTNEIDGNSVYLTYPAGAMPDSGSGNGSQVSGNQIKITRWSGDTATVSFNRTYTPTSGTDNSVTDEFKVTGSTTASTGSPAQTVSASATAKVQVAEKETYTVSEDLNASNSVLANITVSTPSVVLTGSQQITYTIEIENKSNAELTGITVTDQGNSQGTWSGGTTGSNTSSCSVAQIPVNSTAELTYTCNINGSFPLTVDKTFRVTQGTEASPPTVTLKLEGTVYDGSEVTEQEGNAAVSQGVLSLEASTSSPVGYGGTGSSGQTQLRYQVIVTAPRGNSVTVTANPPTGASGSGSWDNTGTSSGDTTTLTGTGSEQTLTYTYTLTNPASVLSSFDMYFWASASSSESTEIKAETETLTTTLANQALSDGTPVENKTIAADQLSLKVSTASVATGTGNTGNITASITYNLDITNNTGKEAVISAEEAGTWKNLDGSNIAESSESITVKASETSKTVTYTRSVTFGGTVSTSFGATVEDTGAGTKNVIAVETKDLETAVYGPEAAQTNTGSQEVVEAELTRDAAYVVENGDVVYSLTLENKGANPIQITTNLGGWNVDDNAGWSDKTYQSTGSTEVIKGQIIAAGGSVTLEKEIPVASGEEAENAGMNLSLGYKIITSESITTYQYLNPESEEDFRLPLKGEPGEPAIVKSGGSIYAGNHLYAGVFAGSLYGTVEMAHQNMDVEAAAASKILSNGAVTAAGGVAGRVGADTNLSDIFIRGNISGANGAIIGLAAAKAEGPDPGVTRLIAEMASDASELGAVDPAGALVGSDAVPGEDWGNWKTFSYYTSAEQKEDLFDLAWLVVDGEDIFQLEDPKSTGESAVKLSISRAGGRELTFRSVYRARQDMGSQEGTSYYMEGNSWELGDSGYYDPVHAYATDGSYHYAEDFASDNGTYQRKYPYTGSKPAFTAAGSPWSVVHVADSSLKDYIRLTLSAGLSGEVKIYDGATRTEIEGEDSRFYDFEFTGDQIQVTAVPTLDGKIYEELVSGTYTAADRDPLPKPRVTSAAYYDKEWKPIQADFVAGGAYEAGSSMNLEDTLDGCTYAFFLSADGPDAHGITWQDGTAAGEEAQAFDTAYGALWEECRVSFRIPEELSGVNYLYLKVVRENYPDTIYSFGSFTVDTPAVGTPRLYYDYDGSTGTEITDRQAAEGDTLVFDMDESSVLTGLQYVISTTQLTGGTLYGADWKDYTGPVALPGSQGAAFCYIYTRMKNAGGDLYGPVSEEIYTYVGDSGSAEASPRTGTVTETGDVTGAAAASGTTVYLDTSVESSRILYLVNNSSSAGISLKRVSGNTAGLTEDGHYYKIGSRWYYTAQEGVKVYEDGSLVLYNETETAVTQYVHTLVLGEGLEPGACVSYIYSVQPTTRAAAPESTLPTRFYPGGSDAEIAQVEKDTYLSFTTLTPGAEMYYVIGSGTVSDQEDPATGTRLYDSDIGILVDAGYGNQFVVSIKTVKWNSDHTRKEMKDSETLQFVFEVADQALAQAPAATPSTSSDIPTTVIPGDKILLSTTTRGASIYYTTDGSAPQVTQKDDGSWQVSGNSTMLYDAGTGIAMPEDGSGFFTIRAVAVHPDLGASPEAQFVYAYPDGVQSPYVNIPSGAVDEGTEIILRNRTEGADIYYTVAYDGGTPADPTISSALFEESQPIVVRGATVIKAFAVKEGVKSPVATFTYSTMDQLSAPEASIASGAMVSRGTRLTLSASGGASIYYTTDGSDPLDSSNTAVIAGDSLVLDGTPGSQITIRAYARKEGKSPSEVVTFTYQISQSVSGVTADVASGSLVSNGSKINLMTDVTDAEIYYTTDGSSPADYGIAGTVVTVDGAAGSTFTVKAVAVVDGEAGTVATFTYRIKEKPTAPNASPSGGVLTVAVRVELSSSADKIYYTTDGTTPTESSSLYAEPILINRTTELKAIAVSEDGESSEVAVFQYTAAAKAAAPTASQKDGALLEPGTVLVLSTETADADIYYTTDGTEPDPDNLEDLQLFTEEGITINRTVTIKAAAYREDLQLSEISEFNYTVETIPAVEMKRAEEERLAAEGLHDTDASALERTGEAETSTYGRRTLQEKTCGTEVSFGRESVPDGVVLVTEEKEYASEALNNVKKVFGDEYTILGSYDIRLMRGGTVVQPDGEVEIGVPVPEGYENAAVTLIYVDSGNKVSQLETRRSGGMIYGRTDHFSHYAVVGLEAPENADRTFPYLLILEGTAGIIAVLGTGYLIRQKWKKYRRYKNSR